MKALIAIISCESYRVNGNNQALRDTWLPSVSKELGLDYRISRAINNTKDESK